MKYLEMMTVLYYKLIVLEEMKDGSTIASMHIMVHAKHKLHCLLSYTVVQCAVASQTKPVSENLQLLSVVLKLQTIAPLLEIYLQ